MRRLRVRAMRLRLRHPSGALHPVVASAGVWRSGQAVRWLFLALVMFAVHAGGCGRSRTTSPTEAVEATERSPTHTPIAELTPSDEAAGATSEVDPPVPKVEPKSAQPTDPSKKTDVAEQAAWLRAAGVRLAESQSPSTRLVAKARDDKATPAIRLGRAGLFLYGHKVVPTACWRPMGRCGAKRAALEQLRFRARDLGAPTDEGPRLMPALAKASRHLKGREVLVLADRTVRTTTLMQTLATLRQVGANPRIGAMSDAGIVALWPDDAPHDRRLPRVAAQGERVPADVEGLTVEITTDGMTVVLQRSGGGYMRRSLRKRPWRALAAWAQTLAAKPTRLRAALFAVAGDVDVGTLSQAVDTLISSCERPGCAKPVRRLLRWQLITLAAGAGAGEQDPGEPPVVGTKPTAANPVVRPSTDVKLRLDDRPGRPGMRRPKLDVDLRVHIPAGRAPHMGEPR